MRWLVLLLLPVWAVADPSGQGLVFPQSACRIRCENGGMCAFSFSDPSVHSCICLIGVYSGDRCQFKIGEDQPQKAQKERMEQALSNQKTVDQERMETGRREAETRLNDQRRREYERKIQEEEARKRAQSTERQRYEEEYRRREEERQRSEEQRRQEIARREEEQRNRAQKDQRISQNQRPSNQEEYRRMEEQRREEQRAREEEKRQEELRRLKAAREESRKQEEEKKEEDVKEESVKEEGRGLKAENYDSNELTDEDLEPDHPEGEQITWDYGAGEGNRNKQEPTEQNSEETTLEKPPANPLGSMADVLENAATKAAEEHGIDLGEEIVTEPHLNEEDEIEEEHDHETVEAVAGVLENAAEKTADEHSIDLNAVDEETEEKKDDNDDYWDHHPKKEDLDYEVPKVMDSEEDEEIQRDQPGFDVKKDVTLIKDITENKVKEYDLEEEEGGDGWMILKHADSHKQQEDGSAGFSFLIAFVLSLRCLF